LKVRVLPRSIYIFYIFRLVVGQHPFKVETRVQFPQEAFF
jgi:hypothetical protein